MTDLSLELSELEIIGYADRLNESFVPQLVPPIFRIRTKSDRVVMPPFRIEGNHVTEAKPGLESDLDRAVMRGQATRLDEIIAARPGYRLWIDETFLPHYEPAKAVAETLRELAHTKARKAQDALAQGRLEEAQRLAQVAISADDGCLNAILVKALVHQLEGDRASVEILTEIAGMIVPGADFLAWVEFFSDLVVDRIKRETYAFADSQVSFVAEPGTGYGAGSVGDERRDEVLDLVLKSHDPEGIPELTRREREILRHLAAGKSTHEISEALEIRPNTLRSHTQNILRKLGARNRVEAVLLALRKGLVGQERGRRTSAIHRPAASPADDRLNESRKSRRGEGRKPKRDR